MHVAWPITITPTNYKEYIMFIGTFLVFTLIVLLGGGSGLAQLLMNHEQRSEKTHEKD
jgi:ABC-type sugar transport system permease subunit